MQPSLIRLAKIYKAFLFLLPLLFLPLEIEWFETPKQFLITLVAVITLPTLITNRHDLKEILEDNLTTLLFALFFVLTLTSLANGYFGYSLLGSPFRRDGLISIWSLFSVYLGFCILYEYKFETYLIESVKSSALAVAILGMIQFLLGYTTIWNGDYFFDGRITSTLGQPNFLSAFLLTSLPFFIRKEKFHSIGLGIIVMCLALTFSRLNLLLIVIALIFSILRAANKKIKYLGICFLTICAIGTIIFFTTVRTDEIYNKIRKNPRLYQLQRNFFFLSKEQLYGEKRFAIYAAGIETILERPVIGYGKAMIEPAMRDNLRKYPVLDTLVVDSSHNIIIDIAIEGGVLALSLLIALLSLTLYRLSSANLWSYKYAFLLLVISSQFFITSIVAFVYLMMLTAKTTTQN
jgi:O-antigen ligase